MNANFYRAFEDLHRGSRDFIRKRQEIYLPLLTRSKHCTRSAQRLIWVVAVASGWS